MATEPTNPPTTSSPVASIARIFGLVLAVVFLAVGVAGFVLTGVEGVTHHEGPLLFGLFMVNPLHNVVHLAIGAIGLALWRTTRGALTYGYVVLGAYFGAFLYGLAAVDETWDVLALNNNDNLLHAGLAVAGAALVGLGHASRADTAPRDRRTWLRSPNRQAPA